MDTKNKSQAKKININTVSDLVNSFETTEQQQKKEIKLPVWKKHWKLSQEMQREKGDSREMRGTWVGQSVKCLTPDFSSGHDMVCGFKTHIRLCADTVEPGWDSLSPSLSLPLPYSLLSLFLSKIS